jgi:hypothetical protein
MGRRAPIRTPTSHRHAWRSGSSSMRWDFPEGSFTYWRGAVTSLELES